VVLAAGTAEQAS